YVYSNSKVSSLIKEEMEKEMMAFVQSMVGEEHVHAVMSNQEYICDEVFDLLSEKKPDWALLKLVEAFEDGFDDIVQLRTLISECSAEPKLAEIKPKLIAWLL